MARWKNEQPSAKTAYMRKWSKTEKGIEYRKRHNEYMRKWRAENKDRFKTNQKRAYDKMRYECLSHYSGGTPACACCGEREILFLHIDPIVTGKQIGRAHV